MRDDVVTCGLDDHVADVRARVERSPHGFALVVSRTGVLLGRLRRSALDAAADARAADVMEAGPSTVRLDSELESLVERMRKRDMGYAIVTAPDGVLAGVLRRADAEARLAQAR
jgi:CBS domain-containing protein